MGIYSLANVTGATNRVASDFLSKTLADAQNSVEVGGAWRFTYLFTILSYIVVLLIELSIPADKHIAPPAPPTALPEPPQLPQPQHKVDHQLNATKDKGGSSGITMGGMLGQGGDHVTAAIFLEPGTLRVHLARSAVQTPGDMHRY